MDNFIDYQRAFNGNQENINYRDINYNIIVPMYINDFNFEHHKCLSLIKRSTFISMPLYRELFKLKILSSENIFAI